MAPELSFESSTVWVSKKADVYSFGVTIYTLLYSPNHKFDFIDEGKFNPKFEHFNRLILASL
uniref:Protein kinase domain-containing protein n=1 Tax=Meloidogyne enterolobii TaxID=390850 RepID=A0A6V7V5E5_MELEN|nr:unnamed protein product [Meloidogyne enterolobii]